jgi:hypothetical protein
MAQDSYQISAQRDGHTYILRFRRSDSTPTQVITAICKLVDDKSTTLTREDAFAMTDQLVALTMTMT